MMEFHREARYIVLKTKGMEDSVVDAVLHLIKSHGFCPCLIPECVVVEQDWPIYEPVWEMVQRLAEGRPQRVHELAKELGLQHSTLVDLRQEHNLLRAALEKIARVAPNLMHTTQQHEVLCYPMNFNPARIAREALAAGKKEKAT